MGQMLIILEVNVAGSNSSILKTCGLLLKCGPLDNSAASHQTINNWCSSKSNWSVYGLHSLFSHFICLLFLPCKVRCHIVEISAVYIQLIIVLLLQDTMNQHNFMEVICKWSPESNISSVLLSQVTSVLPVSWGNTRTTESPALRSPRRSSWPWRGSSGRSSTCPSPSAPSSPPLWPWRRPRWRSGSKTAAPKPRGSRRPSWKSSRWPPTPRRLRWRPPLPELSTPALRYR